MKNNSQTNQNASYGAIILRIVKKHEKPRVFICSPFAGETYTNTIRARRFCTFAVEMGYTPFAPHLLFTQFLNENDPDQREQGILMGMQFLPNCQEIWVFGDNITCGMSMEIALAEELGVTIRYFTNQCKEVPEHAR